MKVFFPAFIILCLTAIAAQASGLGIQSYDAQGNPVTATPNAAPSAAPSKAVAPRRSGMFAYQPDPTEYKIQEKSLQATQDQEYRGYNGRTLKQAFLSCKYEAYRAATPGDPSRGVLEKMRIRMYVMDSCMNREGFFRSGNMPFLDSTLISSGDFFF